MRSRRGLPDTIGRYEVRGTVGGGGMGDVYRVYDPVTRRELALKVLKFTYPRALHYFKREFRAVAALSHENLVELYDLHADGGQYFYTMELIDGTDFYIHVNGHNRVVTHAPTLVEPTRVDRLRKGFIQLLRALAYLHAHGRIHRDIKPSNVLVDTRGVLKLVDFGIVKELLPGGVGQSLSQVFGTSTYFSPEQSLGSQVTAATDLYAAGIVLYELLAGTPPFEGESAEVAVMHRTKAPPSLVQRVPGLPPDLALVCMELLKKDPEDRPSAIEALEMLRAEVEPAVAATEFVGRRDARKILHEALADVRAGHGRLVIVEGAPGLGKSALIDEFGREARLYGATLFTGDCVVRDHVPLRGLDTLVERIAEAYRRQTARVLRRLPRTLRAPLLEGFTFLGELLPTREHGEDDGSHDLPEGLVALLRALADQRLLVLALEQLHLADETVCDTLEALYAQSEPPPVLFLVTLRPDAVTAHSRVAAFQDAVAALPATRRVALRPFTPQETRQLLEDQLDAAPSWLADHIHAQSQGVPLFVAEMVDALKRDPDAAPPTLADTVARRVAALPEAARQVLAVLAVARRPPSAAVLELACDLDTDAVYIALRALANAGLAHGESTAQGAVMVVPRHALIMDIVRESFDAAALESIHARLARAWQGTGGAPGEVHHHWTAAGRPEAATDYAVRAAGRARRTDEVPRAIALLELALDAETARDRRVELICDLADSHARAGHFAAAAEALARLDAEDPAEARRWTARRGQLLILAGDLQGFDALRADLPPDARAPLAALLVGLHPPRAAAVLADADGCPAELVRARLLAADPARAEAALARVDACIEEDQRREPARRAAYALARVEALEALGRTADAQDVVDEAAVLLLHRLPTHDLTRVQLLVARVRLAIDRGQLKAARIATRTLLQDLRGATTAAVVATQARLHLEIGELAAADRHLGELDALLGQGPATLPHLDRALIGIRRQLYGGDPEGARAALDAYDNNPALAPLRATRRPAAERALLLARIRLTRAIRRWHAGEPIDPRPLHDARAALAATVPAPRTWPPLIAAFEHLATGAPAAAADGFDALTRTADRPDHPALLAILRALLATARDHSGPDPRDERRRVERLLGEAGAIMPPELRAMGY